MTSSFDEASGRFIWINDDGDVVLRGTAHRTTAQEMAERLPADHPGLPRLLKDPDQQVFVVDSVDRDDDGAGE